MQTTHDSTRAGLQSPKVRFVAATAPAPGAIGILQLRGPGIGALLRVLTGAADFAGARLVEFDDIDQGLAVMLRDDWAQLFPHGGPRVMQRLTERLIQLGAEPDHESSPRDVYPEATTDLEADLLAALARAASPAVIDILLDQPRRWRVRLASFSGGAAPRVPSASALDHLINPPAVVLVGPANVGKSTLSNLVTGRAMSLTADLPGTTRDWVAGLVELPTPIGALAVRWFDTPGLRQSDDPIERRAIELSARVIESADVLIAVTDPASDFPDPATLGRRPDLHVMNKADLIGAGSGEWGVRSDVLHLSALTGAGLDDLAAAIADRLGLTAADGDQPWAFCDALRRLARSGDRTALAAYLGG